MNDAEALTVAQLSIGEYSVIRNQYKTEITGAIMQYLLSNGGKVTTYKNMMRRAIAQYSGDAFWMGYADAGGDADRPDRDDQLWINAKQQGELGFCDMLFQQLREMKRADGMTIPDMQAEAERRAEGYAKTLDGIYSEGKLRGSEDVLAVFDGNDGMESCPECQKWKGKKHKLSFWLKRGLIPGQPGNAAFSCHGYNCQHFLYNAKTGEILTI